MSFTPSFTLGQDPLYPNICVATDDSGGSDAAIDSRTIEITDSNGNPLVPSGTTTDYVVWPYADVAISLAILDQDEAVSATVNWLDINGAVLYTLTDQFCLAQYSKNFFYYLIQLQGLTPSIPADTNYDSNCALFWARVTGAINAIVNNSDLSGSQNCLNKATEMRQQQAKYF